MYILSVEREFDAAHYLRGYQGRCERLHGHRYRVMAHITVEKLDKTGMAFDFTMLKKILQEALEKYDHRCLNEDGALQEDKSICGEHRCYGL